MRVIQFKNRRTSLLLCLALATGMTFVPLPSLASVAEQITQQASTVTGRVLNSDGEPALGAIIKSTNGKANAIADADGNFSINVPVGTTLEVSLIGYKTQRVKVPSSGRLTVSLDDDTQSLEGVVVVGYGKQKKANLTGAVSVVDGDELAERPVTSAAEALQGLIPGLQISSSSGALDGSPSINIRGVGTIGQGSSGSPLILIDGSEGDINSINSDDIESVSVLKDAAASSIYGSRAPFGVILITTKSGRNGGKVTVNYNNSFRFSNFIRRKKMMDVIDFTSWMNDMHTNSGNSPFFNDERMQGIIAYHNGKPVGPGTRQLPDGSLIYSIDPDPANGTTWLDPNAAGRDDTEWYSNIYKDTSFGHEHKASLRGGFDRGNYYASFGFLDNNGFMKLADENFKRFNGTVKLTVDIAKWVTFNYNMRWARMDYKRPTYMNNDLYYNLARQGWPTYPYVDRNGYFYDSPGWALRLADGGYDKTQRDILNNQVGLVFQPIKNWLTHVDFTYRTINTTHHQDSQQRFNHDINGNPVPYERDSYVHEDENKNNYLNFQVYSEYTWQIAKAHNFHVLAGFQTEQMKVNSFGEQRNGIIQRDKPVLDLTTGLFNGNPVTPGINGALDQWQTAGFFGRFNYNYLERYLFEANLRYDGTSRFRTDKMWKAFPSFSFGWRINEEPFMKQTSSWLSNLKLRLSYGRLGNQNTNNWYQTYQVVNYNPASGTWLQNGQKPNVTSAPGLVSQSLTWETIENFNVGLDFGFLNNRLWGSFDFYVRNTKDMVGNAPELPAILGTGVPVTNNTDMRTTGWELQIGWRDRLSNGLSYSATLNLSDARSKVTRYPNNPTNYLGTYIEGRDLGEIWGYETIGIAKTQEEMDNHLANADQTSIGSNWGPGDIMYADLNGDKKVTQGAYTLQDHGDLKVIGNSTPRYLFGVDLTGSWKGFDLRLFFQGLLKHDVWPSDARRWLFGSDSGNMWEAIAITDNQDYFRDANTWSVQNGYEKENPNAFLPRVTLSDKNVQCQSKYIMNGAYMRLKNLQVGYTIPRSVTQKIGISNLRVFFSGENLFTVSSMPHQFDPEMAGTSVNSANAYPMRRTYSFGLNVTF